MFGILVMSSLGEAREKGFVPISDTNQNYVFVRHTRFNAKTGKLEFEMAVVDQRLGVTSK